MANPFNITFGEIPQNLISREKDVDIVKTAFLDETPETKVFIITGPRGSGKTALLTYLKHEFNDSGFLCVDLNPFNNLEEQFASKLYEQGKLFKLFLQPEFSFSFKGLTFSIKGKTQINNVFTLIERMLEYLRKKGKKVLVTIDDVSPSEKMKSFAYTYQQLIREGYPVFLLMSGLYENVSELEKDKSLTFFLRAPKLNLKPLNLTSIAYSYGNIFSMDDKTAAKYAQMTNGYAYGYQLLGSLLYKNGINSNVIKEYDLKLNENSYTLIWENLTGKEREFLKEMAKSNSNKDIMSSLKLTNGGFQVYKKRLMDKGIIESKQRGKVSFALPRFKEFISMQVLLEN